MQAGRTCVVVAHRLSSVARADVIHVLQRGGAVAESGTHHQLLERGGVYARLAARQAMRLEAPTGAGEEEGGLGDGLGEGGDAVVEIGAGAMAEGGEGGVSGGKRGLRRLRESVLRRGSVRLSVIPQVRRMRDSVGCSLHCTRAWKHLPNPHCYYCCFLSRL